MLGAVGVVGVGVGVGVGGVRCFALLLCPSTSWKSGMLRSTVRHTSHQPHAQATASRDTANNTRAEYSSQPGVDDDSKEVEADIATSQQSSTAQLNAATHHRDRSIATHS